MIYDDFARRVFMKLSRSKNLDDVNLHKKIKLYNITYKNYYLNFLREFENNADAESKNIVKTIMNNSIRQADKNALTTFLQNKILMYTEKTKAYYEIALKLLNDIDTVRTGGRRTRRHRIMKNKKYTISKR